VEGVEVVRGVARDVDVQLLKAQALELVRHGIPRCRDNQ
jgi:hypothetical protein